MPQPIALLLALLPAASALPQDDLERLADLSIEDLLGIEVTSVSRVARSLADSPAAIHVITQEDIRRSGHTTVAELLRTVPGMFVARINSSAWAVGPRGSASRFANSLLVMIDGRTVYSNLFSGVFWDTLDVPLVDVERIEVIRGPGGSVWGANAVDGVINVITKSAAETQGPYASVLFGNEERAIVETRYGGALDDGAYRVFAKWSDRDGTDDTAGSTTDDAWHNVRGGFRMDWERGADSFTLQGDVYTSRVREGFSLLNLDPPFPITVADTQEKLGGNLLGRWSRAISEDRDWSLQGYLDVTDYENQVFHDERNTVDLDFQERRRLSSSQEIVWGLGFRWIDGRFEGTPALAVDPEESDDSLVSAFLQDELRLNDAWSLLLGTKLEHNTLSGFEYEPSARLLWSRDDQSVWAAVSRAVRMPSIVEHGISLPTNVIPGAPPTVIVTTGDEDFESEVLLAYEVGYRARATERLVLDFAAYYYDYDNLTSFRPGTPFLQGGVIVLPLFFDNEESGEAHGFELAGQYEATETWDLHGSFSWTDQSTPRAATAESVAPDYLANLRSSHELADDVDFDLSLYATAGVPGVRSYVRGDARLAWRPREGYELSLVLQNAFDRQHAEWVDEFLSNAREIERSAYVQLSWKP